MAIEYRAPKKEKTGATIGKKKSEVVSELKKKIDSVPAEKRKKGPAKKMITLRLDHDVLESFKENGPGWQSKINDVLRAFAKLGEKK